MQSARQRDSNRQNLFIALLPFHFIIETRMHSNRMHTARCSSTPGGLHQAPPGTRNPKEEAHPVGRRHPWKEAPPRRHTPLEEAPP